MRLPLLILFLSFLFVFLFTSAFAASGSNIIQGNAGSKLLYDSFGTFNEPWAMTFLPDGKLLVTEK